jgi:hypothetical protein
MTVMVESEEGVTHSPPMKNRSVCRIGTDTSLAEMVMEPLPLLVLAPRARRGHSPARIVVSM